MAKNMNVSEFINFVYEQMEENRTFCDGCQYLETTNNASEYGEGTVFEVLTECTLPMTGNGPDKCPGVRAFVAGMAKYGKEHGI